MVIDALSEQKQTRTYSSLAQLMRLQESDGNDETSRAYIRDHTLIRQIELFDIDGVIWQNATTLQSDTDQPLSFVIAKRQLPENIPAQWQVETVSDREVRISITDTLSTMIPEPRRTKVTTLTIKMSEDVCQ